MTSPAAASLHIARNSSPPVRKCTTRFPLTWGIRRTSQYIRDPLPRGGTRGLRGSCRLWPFRDCSEAGRIFDWLRLSDFAGRPNSARSDLGIKPWPERGNGHFDREVVLMTSARMLDPLPRLRSHGSGCLGLGAELHRPGLARGPVSPTATQGRSPLESGCFNGAGDNVAGYVRLPLSSVVVLRHRASRTRVRNAAELPPSVRMRSAGAGRICSDFA